MSKREFKKYIHEQNKEDLENHLLNMYLKFKNVKEYFDFAFKPKEDKILQEAKFKIKKEYFPLNNRKAKARRSIAQKAIKHFILLEVDKYIIADLMLYNLEIIINFQEEKNLKQESFFKSAEKSYSEGIEFCIKNKLVKEYSTRIEQINKKYFELALIGRLQFNNTTNNLIDDKYTLNNSIL